MFCFKLHNKGSNIVLAISDQNIIGKTITNGKIKITVEEGFYGSEACSEQELTNLIEKANIINAIGNEIVSFLIENEFVDKENILEIENIKHAQIIKI